MSKLKVVIRRIVEAPACTGRSNCPNAATEDNHPCPYQQDVNDNHDDICTCCAECEHECAMDI